METGEIHSRSIGNIDRKSQGISHQASVAVNWVRSRDNWQADKKQLSV